MFHQFSNCESMLLSNVKLETENETKKSKKHTSAMFFECYKLKTLDISGFDTTNITNMSFMFRACESLKSLDLSSFNTHNVLHTGITKPLMNILIKE